MALPGGNGFQPTRMLRLGLSFTGGTDISVKFTQPTNADKVKARPRRPRHDRGVGNHRRYGRQALRDSNADGVRQRFGAGLERAQHRRAGRSRGLADYGRRPFARPRILDQGALGAGHRARHPVHLHCFPLRLELHLRLGHRHRAGSRCGDDDRHLRPGRQARRRRLLGGSADGHRLLGHGHDRHPRPNSREHQINGGRRRTTRSSTNRSSRR